MKVPDALGVPEIVIVLLAQAALTPAGSPVAVPMPVAPVVACVILVNAVLIHKVGVLDAAPAVEVPSRRRRIETVPEVRLLGIAKS